MDERLRHLKELAETGDLEAAHNLAIWQFKQANHHVLDFALKLLNLINGQLHYLAKSTQTTRKGYVPYGNHYYFDGIFQGYECNLSVKVPFQVIGESYDTEVEGLAASQGVSGDFYIRSEANISGHFEFGGSYKITDEGWGTISLHNRELSLEDRLMGPIRIATARRPFKKRKKQLRQSAEVTVLNYGSTNQEKMDFYYHPEKLIQTLADIIKLPETKRMYLRNPGEEELRHLEQLASQGDAEAQEKLNALLKKMGLCRQHKVAKCEDCGCEKHQIEDCEECPSQWLEYDSFKIIEAYAEHLRNENPEMTQDEAMREAYEDQDIHRIEWDSICELLTEWMNELNKHSDDWVAVATNLGWRHRSGRKTFRASTGLEMLREVLPRTDNTFTIYRWINRNYLELHNSNHDAHGEVYRIYPETTYAISENPSAWSPRNTVGKITRNITYDEAWKAIDVLEKEILDRWPYVTTTVVRDGEWADKPIGGAESGTTGDQAIIKEIDDYIEANWERIIYGIVGKIEGYHDCDCCGETIMSQAMCDKCLSAGCEGGDKDCQVVCDHSDFRVENGIKICNDCGLGEDGSEHRRNPKKCTKKEEQWFDEFLTQTWYRGTDAKNKGVGVAYMGEGLYLTWDLNMAQAFADLAVAKSKKGPAKIHKYTLKPNLRILDNQSKEMIDFKQSLGVSPWDKINSKIFARAITIFAKENGYDGIVDDNPADGLVIFDPKNAVKLKS